VYGKGCAVLLFATAAALLGAVVAALWPVLELELVLMWSRGRRKVPLGDLRYVCAHRSMEDASMVAVRARATSVSFMVVVLMISRRRSRGGPHSY
jgi:hypothetical protein